MVDQRRFDGEDDTLRAPPGVAENFRQTSLRHWKARSEGVPVAGDLDAALYQLRTRFLSYAQGQAVNDKRAVIVLGYPASGRTEAIKRIAGGVGAAFVDLDYAMSCIPEYEGGAGAAAVHYEAYCMAATIAEDLLLEGTNIILRRVGNRSSTILALLAELDSLGYSTILVHVRMDADHACRKAVLRLLDAGQPFERNAFLGGAPEDALREVAACKPMTEHILVEGGDAPALAAENATAGSPFAQLAAGAIAGELKYTPTAR